MHGIHCDALCQNKSIKSLTTFSSIINLFLIPSKHNHAGPTAASICFFILRSNNNAQANAVVQIEFALNECHDNEKLWAKTQHEFKKLIVSKEWKSMSKWSMGNKYYALYITT